MYKISSRGIKLIKLYEGLELKTYPDPGTGGEPWTIGYGSTGPHVKPGMIITERQAEELLLKDLVRFEKAVNEMVKVPITQGIYDCLVSFSFNVGEGALAGSSVLKLINEKKYAAGLDRLLKWNKAGDRELEGLSNRRKSERVLGYSQPFPK